LNKLPKLRQFLKQEASDYSNIEIQWVGGHTPTAYFRDDAGATTKEVVLEDLDRAGILDFFKKHEFEPKLPQADAFADQPSNQATFKGHHYEHFPAKGPWDRARDFAASRTHNGRKGYIATVTSKAEGEFVRKLAGEEEIWLGASDGAVEGEWRWVQGPEHGTLFWTGTGTQGSRQENNFARWRAHEPNNADTVKEEDCASMGPTGEWNDVPCVQFTGLVIEYGDEPLPQESPQEEQNAKQEL
jgi:hypothetical protein